MNQQIPPAISAADLYGVFQTNIAEAKQLYIGQNLVVSGIIAYIGPDMYGLPSIELSDSSTKRSQTLFVFRSGFPKDIVLERGMLITISGECIDVMPDGMVVIKKCEIEK